MAQRRHHYERAFEAYLRRRRLPYVAVDEAKKALLPADARLEVGVEGGGAMSLKSFDFVLYTADGAGPDRPNLLVDVKGRKVGGARRPGSPGRLESWVTEDDVASLRVWERLFGRGFAAAFVFVYWCDQQPPDGLFQEIFTHGERWYATRAVRLGEYARHMRPRSRRWRTVHVPRADFERISHPLERPGTGAPAGASD
jgi:hypothetical protein